MKWEIPVKNFLEGEFDSFGQKFVARMVAGEPMFCRHCTTSCIESRKEGGVRHVVWEAITPLGSQCLIDDMEAIREAYDLCQRYGLDSISTGAVIAFAMECYEKGLITKDDTGGIDLRWGNAGAMVQMVRKIGEKEGFGEILGWGSKEAARHIGGIACEYAMHVKGLELPAHDPRVHNGTALEYATSNYGASHMSAMANTRISPEYSWADFGIPPIGRTTVIEGMGTAVAKLQDMMCLLDSLSCCKLPFLARANYLELSQASQPHYYLEWLNLATGWDMSLAEFLKCGERIYNLQRMTSVRRGISRKDDMLPPRILTHKRGGKAGGDVTGTSQAPAPENLPPLGALLNEYYLFRGWSEEGIPTKKKLAELGLEEIVGSL